MECNFQVEELATIAAALEFYRDHMARDVELTADNRNLARYFQLCADGANGVLTSVRARLGRPEKPWKDVEPNSKTAQEIEGSCEGCMHIDCERDERPCSECCRLDRVDRYEQEGETLADVFPDYNMEV